MRERGREGEREIRAGETEFLKGDRKGIKKGEGQTNPKNREGVSVREGERIRENEGQSEKKSRRDRDFKGNQKRGRTDKPKEWRGRECV